MRYLSLAVFLLPLCGCSSEVDSSPSPVLRLNDANFKKLVLGAKQPVLVDFSAVWCGPCREMVPIIKRLAREFDGKAVVCKIDVDESPITASTYQISGIPCMLIFQDGKVVARYTGVTSRRVLAERLRQLETQATQTDGTD
ncbi:MAG: thioredoxin [Planctomycetes bacterium]|nr:thioredoxin [Planctomycetota bacterium]